MAAVFQIYNLKIKTAMLMGKEYAEVLIPDNLVNGDNLSIQDRANNMNLIIHKMENELSKGKIMQIRKSTSCNITKKQKAIIDDAKKLKTNVNEQIEMVNDGISPSKVEISDEKYYFNFNRKKCICRMFDKLDNPTSTESYCYCCAGNVEKIMEYLTGNKRYAIIKETFLMKGKNCIFEIDK